MVKYKITDPQNYLLMTFDCKILRDLFEHKRLRPAIIRTNQRIICNLSQLKTDSIYRYENIIIISL